MKIAFSLMLCILLEVAVYAATYKGKSIDGKEFKAYVTNSDGAAMPVQVVFDGRVVSVHTESRTFKLYIPKEEIDDPRKIPAYDDIHTWVIELQDKLE